LLREEIDGRQKGNFLLDRTFPLIDGHPSEQERDERSRCSDLKGFMIRSIGNRYNKAVRARTGILTYDDHP
jgi:hypothetical protein